MSGWLLAGLLLWVLYLIVSGERSVRTVSPAEREQRRQVDVLRLSRGLPPMDWNPGPACEWPRLPERNHRV